MKLLPLSVEYNNLGTADFESSLNTPIEMVNRKLQIKVLNGSALSKAIPNIFAYEQWNNTFMYVTRDNWATELRIDFFRGNYSVNSLNQAIQNLISSWFLDTTDPAFYLSVNPSMDRLVLVIDNNKMTAGGLFGIDFSRSDLWKTLGFAATKKFTGTQIASSDVNPQLDHFGSTIGVYLEGLGDFSLKNGANSTYLATINANNDPNASLYQIPTTGETPIEIPNPPSYLKRFKVSFVGGRESRKIVTFDGEAVLNLGLIIS